jgi:hypothetical protein
MQVSALVKELFESSKADDPDATLAAQKSILARLDSMGYEVEFLDPDAVDIDDEALIDGGMSPEEVAGPVKMFTLKKREGKGAEKPARPQA